jgi:menaquinone-specific isochorismate synthase
VRAYAGAGVVAASDAHQELEETGWKFMPIQEALGAVAARS